MCPVSPIYTLMYTSFLISTNPICIIRTDFKTVYDADLIVNLEEKYKNKPVNKERVEKTIEKLFLTKSGKKEAKKVFWGLQ